MPRNKYPEETQNKIIDKALELFTTKGYENTSIQDIIDATKLSKGAIYHHFDSKEKILLTVYDRIGKRVSSDMAKIVSSKKMNGRQKIQAMFMDSFSDNERMDFMVSMPNLLENPHFLALHLKDTMKEIAPKYVYPVLLEGIEDGSLKCKYPMETAQVIMALSNIWMNPLIYNSKQEDPNNKTEILSTILSALGIELQDNSMFDSYDDVVNKVK